MALGGQVPARLGRYELLARLATGGMGEIFLARLEGAAGFEKLYVVKRILPHLADDARFRAMLIAEARIASKLSHANICQVYELGETDGQLYIVMEYLEGVTMLPLLRKASKDQTMLDFGLVAAVIQQATDALHYAHELRDRDRGNESVGIVHRDVTPSNIFLTDAGVAKLLDFGIAKVKDASANTQTGTVKGKYAYMAPEQLRGQTIDRRADVFALGIVAYEMLGLRRLFQRKTDYLTFRAVMEQPIPDIRRYRSDIPDALADTLAHALERDPDKRFATARQFGSAIVDALATLKRPWTQGEVGDFVRAHFADEIGKRSEQVASAIHRTKESNIAPGRMTMPLIIPDPDAPADVDDDLDGEFPPVESAISETTPPPGFRHNTPTDFHGVTPPPFGADSSTSGHQIQPLGRQILPPPQPAPPHARRSILWPILAICMIGIAGGALFLVWRQMQMQQQPVVNITSEPARPDLVASPAGSAEHPDKVPTKPPDEVPDEHPDGSDAGSATSPGSATPTKTPTPTPRPARRGSYDEAIQAHKARIAKCAREHGAPPSNAKVVIVVTTAGKAKTISLQPADLDSSPLGACIKRVLAGARYPTAAAEMQVSVALKSS